MEKAGMEHEKRVLQGGQDLVYYAIYRKAFHPDEAPYSLRHR